MSDNLVFIAGAKAYAHIKDAGLAPDDVKMMSGAAGGPKWLILRHIDRVLFSSWFAHRKTPLFLIGSSSGAWRFACASQVDPASAVERFEQSYIAQYYRSDPSPEDISREGLRIMNQVLGTSGISEILAHPYLRLNIMTVRCKGLAASDQMLIEGLGMSMAALCNLIHRRGLKLFFERALFYDARDIPPFFDMSEFPIHRIALNKKNLKSALMASGSIPMVMSGVKDIPGAPVGTYRDGGITDYHIDIPFVRDDGIVLFPHYTNRIIPGWLDKKLFWRKPDYADNVLLLSPSEAFLNRLPYRKIPDRTDFQRFKGQDNERIAYWKTAVRLSKILSDEFMEAVDSGRIREKVTIIRYDRR
jgi:hypothetical protein